MIRYLLACLLAAAPVAGQVVQPGKATAFTPLAKAQLDSLAVTAASTRNEQSACVVTFGVDDSLYIVARIAPAHHIVHSDSISIAMDGPACEWWQPVIHTHVVDGIYLETPSGPDYRTTAIGRVFGLLMSVRRDSTWSLRSYP
jgi:hypothetical protein